jgi:hypothetical protein
VTADHGSGETPGFDSVDLLTGLNSPGPLTGRYTADANVGRGRWLSVSFAAIDGEKQTLIEGPIRCVGIPRFHRLGWWQS